MISTKAQKTTKDEKIAKLQVMTFEFKPDRNEVALPIKCTYKLCVSLDSTTFTMHTSTCLLDAGERVNHIYRSMMNYK